MIFSLEPNMVVRFVRFENEVTAIEQPERW